IRQRWKFVSVGIALFMLAPLPVLGLRTFDFQFFSTVADHYLYVAMLGPSLLAAGLLARFWRWPAVLFGGGLLMVWMILSFRQAGYWKNTFALFEHTERINP